MEQVMRLMGGSVHCFVPFNPWASIRNPELFAVLTDAIERRGFIGFKLYPPMGFAPWGNQKLGENERPPIWSKQGPRFPRELDDAMMTLFAWCSNNDVPIMAHANPSNGPDEPSEVIGSPSHWRRAYEQMASAGIKPPAISFGHFGGDNWNDDKRWGGELAKLFLEQPRAYADLSYWEHVLDPPDSDDYARVTEALKTVFRSNPEATNRLLYGTDWSMLAIEDRWQDYFSAFGRVIATSAGSDSSIARNIAGLNASRYLGLVSSGDRNNRARLLEFYARWGIPAPSWALKTQQLV
jgi:predicted TIM-barrel fold metal-dependent hydrolase